MPEKKGNGTAQSSGSKQGARQRKYADDSSAPTDPAKVVGDAAPVRRSAQNAEGVSGSNWPGAGARGDSDALIGHFAVVVGGEYDGLYGVVQDVYKVGDSGEPLEADFEIRSRPSPGLEIPETGNGKVIVPWENLRRSVAGLR